MGIASAVGLVRYHSVALLLATPLLLTSVALAQSSGSFPDVSSPSEPAPQPTAPPDQPAQPQEPPPQSQPAQSQPAQPQPAQSQPAQPQYPPSPSYAQQQYGQPQHAADYGTAASAALPPTLPYEEGQPIPANYRLESRANTGLMIGGALTVGAGYATALIFAAASDFENGTGWNAVPVIGPYGAIGARKFRCNKQALQNTDCFDKAVDEVEAITFLAVDGLVQAVGLTLLIVGAADRKTFLVREDVKLTFVPRSFEHGFGVGVQGNF